MFAFIQNLSGMVKSGPADELQKLSQSIWSDKTKSSIGCSVVLEGIILFDYKEFLNEINDKNNVILEVFQSNEEKKVEIGGNKNGLLYLACRILDFVENDSQSDFAEMNLDVGIDLSRDSSSLCVFWEGEK